MFTPAQTPPLILATAGATVVPAAKERAENPKLQDSHSEQGPRAVEPASGDKKTSFSFSKESLARLADLVKNSKKEKQSEDSEADSENDTAKKEKGKITVVYRVEELRLPGQKVDDPTPYRKPSDPSRLPQDLRQRALTAYQIQSHAVSEDGEESSDPEAMGLVFDDAA